MSHEAGGGAPSFNLLSSGQIAEFCRERNKIGKSIQFSAFLREIGRFAISLDQYRER
jgi:hypothetical protein